MIRRDAVGIGAAGILDHLSLRILRLVIQAMPNGPTGRQRTHVARRAPASTLAGCPLQRGFAVDDKIQVVTPFKSRLTSRGRGAEQRFRAFGRSRQPDKTQMWCPNRATEAPTLGEGVG